jgi:hypothetical protein
MRQRPSELGRTMPGGAVGGPNDTLAFETSAFHVPKEEE